MSGSGGFYKYRCKYFWTYNCDNWVYANGHACQMCLALGREAAELFPVASSSAAAAGTTNPWHPHPQQHLMNEICVPQAFHGTLQYTVMEIVPADEATTGGGFGRAYWTLRHKVMEQPQAIPAVTLGAIP